MAESSRSYAPGQLIGNKYSIVQPIGSGGMGIVYEALHTRLGQRVAVKMLLPDLAESAEAVARFEREARAAAHLRSTHVARVFDVDTLPDGTPYIVMEFLEGRDLADELLDRGPLPVREAVDYLLQACDGMAEAHRIGIVHRDLKPSNLFLADDGHQSIIKVLDFGISKVGEAVAPSVTTTRMGLGTAVYMSPEQVRSAKNVDARSDVWALGVVLYELLTGCSPFEGDTSTAVAAAIVADPAQPLRSLRDDVPPELETVVMKALEKDRERRYADADVLATALAPFGTPRAERPARPPDRTMRTSTRAAPTRLERDRDDPTIREEVLLVAPEEGEWSGPPPLPPPPASDPIEEMSELASRETAKLGGGAPRVTEVAGSPRAPETVETAKPLPVEPPQADPAPVADVAPATILEKVGEAPTEDEPGPPPIIITAKPSARPAAPSPSVVPVTAPTSSSKRMNWSQPRTIAVLGALVAAVGVSFALVHDLTQESPSQASGSVPSIEPTVETPPPPKLPPPTLETPLAVAQPAVTALPAASASPIASARPIASAPLAAEPAAPAKSGVAPRTPKRPKPTVHEKTGLPSDPG